MPRSKASRRRARQERSRRLGIAPAPARAAARDDDEQPVRGRGRAGAIATKAGEPEQAWSRRQLAILVASSAALVTLVSLVVGLESGTCVPLLLATANWSPIFVLVASPAVAPIAKAIARAPRNLRFLESIGVGAVLAVIQRLLVSLLLSGTPDPGLCVSSVPTKTLTGLVIIDLASVGLAMVVAPFAARRLFASRRRR